MKSYSIGIIKQHLNNKKALTKLANAAIKAGFHNVIAFRPMDVKMGVRLINAIFYTQTRWIEKNVPFPSIIYDLGYYTKKEDAQRTIQIQRKSNIPFVGYSMGSKIIIHQHLLRSSQLKPYLIPTYLISTENNVINSLKSYEKIIIKPTNSWGGKGIYIIEKKDGKYIVYQNQKKQSLNSNQFRVFLKNIRRSHKYLVQPWLDIRTTKGQIADHRVLIQKNHIGEWIIRGIATRVGRTGNITSNIKSGGKVFATETYLENSFGIKKAKELYKTMKDVSYSVANSLEKSFRKRFVEFGIDYAITTDGQLKIIEVNIKPGRNILNKVADSTKRKEVFLAPFYYAYYLLTNKG